MGGVVVTAVMVCGMVSMFLVVVCVVVRVVSFVLLLKWCFLFDWCLCSC